MRILGIDFGDSRTGAALSDPLGWTAQGLEVIRGGMDDTAARVASVASEYKVGAIVVGYPLNMNGSAGFRAERTDKFIGALRREIDGSGGANSAVEIIKWDERLTSAEAAKVLKASGKRPTSRSVRETGKLDILSASILLQSYLDHIGGSSRAGG